jgi:sensor histidine kinase regulating citrate/malate metabolism
MTRTAATIPRSPIFEESEGREQALAELILALRSETHEYANRIHAISGLLALDMAGAAEGLVADLALEHVGGGAALLDAIDSPALVGLLVAKRAAGRQRGVDLQIDEQSCLEQLPGALTELDAISLLGNLIDNAFDAVAPMSEQRRVVEVGIYQGEGEARFRVTDHGPGFHPSVEDRAFKRGCTSKPDHHGLGLAIVAAIVERAGGELEVGRTATGTRFQATFRAG